MLGRKVYQIGTNGRWIVKYVKSQYAMDRRRCFEQCRFVTSSIYCTSPRRDNNYNNEQTSIDRRNDPLVGVNKKHSQSSILNNLKADLPLSKRENYLFALATSERYSANSQVLPSAIFPLLESMLQQYASPLSTVKVIQSIGDLNLPSSRNAQEMAKLVAVMLDRLALVSKPNPKLGSATSQPDNDTVINFQHALKRSDDFGRCLLSFRKLQVHNRSLTMQQRQVLLGLIDAGFRLHAQQDAHEESSFFNFSNLIYNTGRLDFSWTSLLPSTQQAILGSLRIHGNQCVEGSQQLAMLINGLGELAFPLSTPKYADIQQIVLNWATHTLKATIEESQKFERSQKMRSKSKQGVKKISTQPVASVIFGLSEMQCRLQPTLSPELRKLLMEGVQCTIGYMPEYLVCTTVYNLGLMGLTWKHLSREGQMQVSQAVTTAFNKAQLHPLSLLLSGLANMNTNMRFMPLEFRRALDNCIFQCLDDVRFNDQATSQTTSRIIRSLGDINLHWSELSEQTQSALLGKFNILFQNFLPKEVVMGIRGMGLLDIPSGIVHNHELFSSIIHAIDRVHRFLNDRDVTTLIVGLSKLNISWATIPAKTRDGLIRVLQHGNGLSPTGELRAESIFDGDRFSNNDASSPTYSSSLISYLLYGLAGMDVNWGDLERSLRSNILQRFLRPHALNILYPQDIARVFWGLGSLDVAWPEELFHKQFHRQQGLSSFPGSTNHMAPNQDKSAPILPIDFIPSQLLVQLRLAIPKMQLLDVMQSLQGCRMLGITWTELATTDGSIHRLLVQRILKLLPQATTENTINLLHELSCLSFQTDRVILTDRSSVPHPTDVGVFEEVGSLLDAYETILNQLHTQQRDVAQAKPLFVDKFRISLANLATILEGKAILQRTGWEAVSPSVLGQASAQHISKMMTSSSSHSLTHEIATILRDEFAGSDLLIEESLSPQASSNQAVNDHKDLFTSFDIVIRDASSKTILAIVELHDQRVRWTSNVLRVASTAQLPTIAESTSVTLGKPKKYFCTLPHLLKRQLYRHYLANIPIFQLEFSGATYVGENDARHKQQERHELSSSKAVRELLINLRIQFASE